MKEKPYINKLYQDVFKLINDNDTGNSQNKWSHIIEILKHDPLLEINTKYGNNINDLINNYNLYYFKYYSYLKEMIKLNISHLIEDFDKWVVTNDLNLNSSINTEISEIGKLQNILPINKSILTPLLKSPECYITSNRFLDCFARLIKGNEVCTSSAYANNTIFISSNNCSPIYAKTFNNLLVLYLDKKSSIDNLYSEVVYTAIKALEAYLLRNINHYDNSIPLKLGDPFHKLLYLFIKSFSSKPLLKEILFELFNESLEYFINFKDSSESNYLAYNASLILSRIKIDIDFVINFINNNRLSQIVESLRANNIYYICGQSMDNSHTHSEMKIAQYFFKNNIKKAYIGSSMLSCALCHLAFTSLIEHNFEFDYYGTHGYEYLDWEVPKIFLANDQLESTLKNKIIHHNNTIEMKKYIENFEIRTIT